MDSLSDHTPRRSTRRRGPDRGSGGAAYAANRILLLIGALLFINGISITFIAALIPFAISSTVVIPLVTVLTVLAYVARRNHDRTRALLDGVRPTIASLLDRDRPRRQGGL